MTRSLTTPLVALLTLLAGVASRPALADAPKSCGTNPNVQVELFMQQKTGTLQPGQTKAVKVRGQLFGNVNFRGNITLAPNGPASTACPVFKSGDNNNLNLQAGQPFVVFVTLQAPGQPTSGNCALKYSALYTDRTPPCEAGKGNQVNKPYLVRVKPPQPGEDFE